MGSVLDREINISISHPQVPFLYVFGEAKTYSMGVKRDPHWWIPYHQVGIPSCRFWLIPSGKTTPWKINGWNPKMEVWFRGFSGFELGDVIFQPFMFIAFSGLEAKNIDSF